MSSGTWIHWAVALVVTSTATQGAELRGHSLAWVLSVWVGCVVGFTVAGLVREKLQAIKAGGPMTANKWREGFAWTVGAVMGGWPLLLWL